MVAMSAPMAIETPRQVPDLSSLKIRREPERPKRPFFLLILGAVLAVGIAVGAYALMSPSWRALEGEKTTADLITEGQALTVLSAAGYGAAETEGGLTRKIA